MHKYTFPNAFSSIKISIKILLKRVCQDPIGNKSALLQMILAWRWKGENPLSAALMTSFTNAYMRILSSISELVVMISHAPAIQHVVWLDGD